MKSTVKTIVSAAALLLSSLSHAAFVTTDEAGMDLVFSQATFASEIIDIRFGAVTQLFRSDLLNIQTPEQVTDLFNQHVGDANVVNFFFIDAIDHCGSYNVNIIGCGQTPGNSFVVESSFAAQTTVNAGKDISVATNLLAHELGHNLGLLHRDDGNNLMNSSISEFMALNAAEVATIRSSSLVQHDASGYFIMINPVLVTAVPEPSTYLMAFAGLALLGMRFRKARAQA